MPRQAAAWPGRAPPPRRLELGPIVEGGKPCRGLMEALPPASLSQSNRDYH